MMGILSKIFSDFFCYEEKISKTLKFEFQMKSIKTKRSGRFHSNSDRDKSH